MIDVTAIKVGETLQLHEGIVAVVVENMEDGMWLQVRYLEVSNTSAVVGAVEKHQEEARLSVPTLYLEAIERAGGLPVVVHPLRLQGEDSHHFLDRFGALVLTCGVTAPHSRGPASWYDLFDRLGETLGPAAAGSS